MIRRDLLSSIRRVVDSSQYVRVNELKIDEFVTTYTQVSIDHWKEACPFEYSDFADFRDEIDYRFLVDSQAFCFWGYPEKWTTTYQDLDLDGWWAMLASVKRAHEEGMPIFSGQWLAQLSQDEVKQLFSGTPEIPMLEERRHILRGIGNVLVEKYEGRFHAYLLAHKAIKALDLAEDIQSIFPGFDDNHVYKGETVRFLKKAQLLVNDLASIDSIESLIVISDLDQLIGKADYKIPAILRKFGILEYTEELAELVDAKQELVAGSEMEVEIRANMLWATELIAKGISARDIPMTAILLDNILWVMSQDKTPGDKPYHLCRTVDY